MNRNLIFWNRNSTARYVSACLETELDMFLYTRSPWALPVMISSYIRTPELCLFKRKYDEQYEHCLLKVIYAPYIKIHIHYTY